jgi:hypothetical protein
MRITRRGFTHGLAVSGALAAAATTASSASDPRKFHRRSGCILAANGLAAFTDQEPIIEKSGDRAFDIALAHLLARISKLFGVLPGFGFYDDYDGLNAFASATVRMGRADGTVLFGTRLLKRERSLPEAPELAVASVCAHEFAHIVQMKRNLSDRLLAGQTTVKRRELHADYLAGFFAGVRKRERPGFPAAVFATTQRSWGDTDTQSPEHHGTPTERGLAIVEGFNAAMLEGISFDLAVDRGLEYVESL